MTAARTHSQCDFSKNTRLLLLAFMTLCMTGIGWCLTNDYRATSALAREKKEMRQELKDHKKESQDEKIENVKNISTMKQDIKHIKELLEKIEKKIP